MLPWHWYLLLGMAGGVPTNVIQRDRGDEPDTADWTLSDQFLMISSNLSARRIPRLARIRLAEAAAANHALQAAREVDDLFCSSAELWFEKLEEIEPTVRSTAFDIVKECCDLAKFDILASDRCFPIWPTWSIRVCCAYFLRSESGKSSNFGAVWKDVLGSTLFEEYPNHTSREFTTLTKGVIAYHKSGITISSELTGDILPGPLACLVLDRPQKVVLPDTIHLHDYGKHRSPRSGKPVITPYFQAFTRYIADSKGNHTLVHFSNPLKSWEPQLQDLLADDGAGLLLHLVRRPSDMIVSGYRYHSQQRIEGEEWLHFTSPPDCLSCDHEAWAHIFGRCAFRCSYYQLLQNLTTREGLQVEYLRSRWDITKMLQHAVRWRYLANVLQMPMESFRIDFNGTLRCIARFFHQMPVGRSDLEGFEASEKMVRFLEESQIHAPSQVESCREALERGETCRFVNGSVIRDYEHAQHVQSHVASKLNRQSLKAELKLTKAWKHFIIFADATFDLVRQGATAEKFGCPKV